MKGVSAEKVEDMIADSVSEVATRVPAHFTFHFAAVTCLHFLMYVISFHCTILLERI